MLVLEVDEPLAHAAVGGGLNGIEGAQAVARRDPEAGQEAGVEDVGGREIELGAKQIGGAPARVAVLTGGEFVDDGLVVLRIQAVGEPGAAPFERPGEFEARRPAGDGQALAILEAGDEIGYGIAEAVVAGRGLESQDAGRPLAELRGVESGNLHGADCLEADAALELAGERVVDFETIEGIEDLLFGAAIEMNAAGGILNHAGHGAHDVAERVGGGEREREQFGVGEALLGRGAFEIDDRGRIGDVDLVEDLAGGIQHQRDFVGALGEVHRAGS